jgi:hypothetical protein
MFSLRSHGWCVLQSLLPSGPRSQPESCTRQVMNKERCVLGGLGELCVSALILVFRFPVTYGSGAGTEGLRRPVLGIMFMHLTLIIFPPD